MTKEQAEAFAVLLEGEAFQNEDWEWSVSYDDEKCCSTFLECLDALADELDFELVPYVPFPEAAGEDAT